MQPWVMVAKDIFPFATMTDGCKKVNFMEFFFIKSIFLVEISQMWCSKCHFHGKIPWNYSLRNCQAWLRREKYPSQPWLMRKIFSPLLPSLMVAKALISWDFPIIFMKISWLLKTCICLWIWRKKKANFISHSSKWIPRILNLI